MEKKLFCLSLVSLALFLVSCGSSAPETPENSGQEDVQQEETAAEPAQAQSQQGMIRFEDFELTYTEKDSGLDYEGVYVSLTNHTDYLLLSGKIDYTLKPQVSYEDVQAAMPADYPFDPDAYERMSKYIWPEKNVVTLEPSGVSGESAVMIYTPRYEDEYGAMSQDRCPATKGVMDLMEVMQLEIDLIVDGQLKSIWLQPGDIYPVFDLQDSQRTLNAVVEGAEELIVVPDGVTLYTTYNPNIPGSKPIYVFTFYQVDQTVMEQCIEEYKALYPDGNGGPSNYYGKDDAGNQIMLNWDEEEQIITGEIHTQ